MNNFKQLVDSINNDGATKYIEFINKFFIFGFLTLFTGFKETFYSVDSFLLLIICISISTCLYLGVEIIVNITYLILKVDKQISEYIIDELKFAGNYITEKDPSLKKSNYVKYQTSIKRSKYIRSPQFFTDKIIKIINLLFATLIIFKITKS